MPHDKTWEFRIHRFRFRPTLVPTLFTIGAVAVMLGLGTWQIQRMFWKDALIAKRVSHIEAPPIAPPAAGANLADFEFYRLRLRGTFLNDREMYLAARSLRGNVGYHVVTPLRLEGGGEVLVDRGWVPHDRKNPADRAAGQLKGVVTLEGVIRIGGRKSVFVPDNRPQKNVWFYVDVPAMAAAAHLSSVAPYYLEAIASDIPGGLPIGGQTRINLPNNHLIYVITWYSLALALIVIYLVYHRVKED